MFDYILFDEVPKGIHLQIKIIYLKLNRPLEISTWSKWDDCPPCSNTSITVRRRNCLYDNVTVSSTTFCGHTHPMEEATPCPYNCTRE